MMLMKILKTIIHQRIVLTVFDYMTAAMESNKKLSPIVTELLWRGCKIHVSLVFISQSYIKVPKSIRLIAIHYFIMKIPNKRELWQIASNHSSIIGFWNFMKLYKNYTKKPYSFLVNVKLYQQIIHYDLQRSSYKN